MVERAVEGFKTINELSKRINIPSTSTSPPGLIEANTVDPFSQAGKYALGWTYFCLILVGLISITRVYHWWTDKMRQALFKDDMAQNAITYSPADYMTNMETGGTVDQLFPRVVEKSHEPTYQSSWSSIGPINDTLALFRWIFYRPIPAIRYKKHTFSFPSLAVTSILIIALAFVTLYCFLPQPLYWQSIRFGSPPLAIRAGMIAVAMTPWIIATSMKANLISMLTGISHERLNVLHRWGGYLCLFLSLVHTIPFYIQPVWKDDGLTVFTNLVSINGIVYGTGICCLAPLGWLCLGSIPIIRTKLYELFLVLHIPAAFLYVGMLFWHCQNYLTSWDYLYATAAIWLLSYIARLFNLNWANPWRYAWLIGDEAAVTLMSENAIKVTIPTQMKWRPGQFVYLRMPGISVFENHPFTIASLCSEDFPSEYGEMYRDCILVFRPFGGFTRRVLDTAIEKGPFKTYRAYLDGPYGGMQRELAAFDTVILFAGGSGITAIVSQLLNLIKRMRDGKAVTRKVEVVWALKRLEAMDWFREELRICREYAPPDTVTCQFYVTAAVRQSKIGHSGRAPRPISTIFHDKLDGFVAGVASKRNSALIRDEAQGDPERERELRAEEEDAITSLPRQKYLQPAPPKRDFSHPPDSSFARKDSLRRLEGRQQSEDDDHSATRQYLSPDPSARQSRREFHFPAPQPRADAPHFQFAPPSASPRRETFFPPSPMGSDFPPPPPGPPPKTEQKFFPPPVAAASSSSTSAAPIFPPPPQPAHLRASKSIDLHVTIPSSNTAPAMPSQPQSNFDFGFPSTPTEFQKNLMRFAFLGPPKKKEGWSTEYGRPDLAYMLKEMATGGEDGKGILGRRTCVFVCGPPGMRIDVANAVAGLQADIWGDDSKDEIFLHTENYAI
jgi:predicted ferric reductase